jgi:putative transposase
VTNLEVGVPAEFSAGTSWDRRLSFISWKVSMTTRKVYTTDLSDLEWQVIEPLIPGPKRLGRKIDYSRREILNAIFYLNRNGCSWRDLADDFPPYGIVSHFYNALRRNGVWQSINEALRMQLRVAEGRHA